MIEGYSIFKSLQTVTSDNKTPWNINNVRMPFFLSNQYKQEGRWP